MDLESRKHQISFYKTHHERVQSNIVDFLIIFLVEEKIRAEQEEMRDLCVCLCPAEAEITKSWAAAELTPFKFLTFFLSKRETTY